MIKSLRSALKNNPELHRAFSKSRVSRKRQTSVYDISATCTLRCEGCLFFDRDGEHDGSKRLSDTESYRLLFQEERDRGVNYPIFGGAEPALNPKVLNVATEFWSQGMVHTNGIKKIRENIPFKLYVSLWGHKKLTEKWRGKDCYLEVLGNIEGDSRVMVNYTVNAQNIHDILPVAHDLSSRGVPMTFQAYSPTEDYVSFIENSDVVGTFKYLSGSNKTDNLLMTREDELSANQEIKKAIDVYPDTVNFSHALSDWVFGENGMTKRTCKNGNNIPLDCSVSMNYEHKHYYTDLQADSGKTCGHPNINCETCRVYTILYTSYFYSMKNRLTSSQSIIEYLKAHEIFYNNFYS